MRFLASPKLLHHACCSCTKIRIVSSYLHTTSSIPSSVKQLPEYGKHAEMNGAEQLIQSLADSSLIQSVEHSLIAIHDSVGLPWWATIIATTLTLRTTITLPLLVYSMKNQQKMTPYYQALGMLQTQLSNEVKKASVKNKWDAKTEKLQYQANLARHQKELNVKLKPPSALKRYIVPFAQVPIWVSMSLALRDLSLNLQRATFSDDMMMTLAQLSQEGALWFHDLTLHDHFYALPIITCLANLAIVEVHGVSRRSVLLAYLMRGLCIVQLVVSSQLPAAVVLYWQVSSLFGLAQALVLKTPPARSYFDPSKYSLKPAPAPQAKSD